MMLPLISPIKLAATGILGMNCRNVNYIGRYNPRALYPLVDNKLKTKLLADKYGVATSRLRFVLQFQHETARLGKLLAGLSGFAMKPAKGSGGKGIVVITSRRGDEFIKPSGLRLSLSDLERDASNTLAGLYSLGGVADNVIIEDLVQFDPCFDGYSYQGVPDIRFIVFRGYPVMGMLRLATRASDGKANLHQGAVGLGLDLATGRGIQAVQYNRRITTHPDTGHDLFDLQIPHWDQLLVLAARCYEMTGLGYIGTDMVLDAQRGPLLMELNARPGLSIQAANDCGLLPRLRQIECLSQPHSTPEARVSYVREALLCQTGF